jgi:hypothetical protein
MDDLVQEVTTAVDDLRSALNDEDSPEALDAINRIEGHLKELKAELEDTPTPTEV